MNATLPFSLPAHSADANLAALVFSAHSRGMLALVFMTLAGAVSAGV